MRTFGEHGHNLCWKHPEEIDSVLFEDLVAWKNNQFRPVPEWQKHPSEMHRWPADDLKTKDIHPEERDGFALHDRKIYQVDPEKEDNYRAVSSYKVWSSVNGVLRKAKRVGGSLHPRSIPHPENVLTPPPTLDRIKKHVAGLDRVTSYNTRVSSHYYRGIDRLSGIHLKKPGEEFIDHGYTGTSRSPDVAIDFSGEHHGGPLHGYRILARIHVPPGTKGHYLEQNKDFAEDFGEKEFLLHRGTRFRVTGHSVMDHPHSRVHIMHMTVAGQHPKKIEWPQE